MSQITQKHEEPGKKLSKTEAQKKWEAEREKDLEMVTGVFEYKEKGKEGQIFEFRYSKYGEEFKKFRLKDKGRYRIPRMIARHLNNNCFYPHYARLEGPLGKADVLMGSPAQSENEQSQMYAVNKEHRVAFYPLDFMDDEVGPKKEIIEIAYF